MSKWPTTPKWSDLSAINQGQEYTANSGLDYKDMNTLVENMLYLKNTSGGSGINVFYAEGNLPTVFSNEDLCTSQKTTYEPRQGDVLLVPEINAVYRYIQHSETTNPLRVYAYQAFRDDNNIADAESVANLVGNFTCTYSSKHTDGKYHYVGDLADTSITDEIANTGNPFIYTLGHRGEFNEYMRADGDGEYKKTPLIFRNSPFRLVASYTIPWNEGDSPSDLAKTYLAEHIDDFPLVKLKTETGGTADGIIYIIEAADVTFSHEYGWICSKFIDSALALEAFSPSAGRTILFEFWNGGCYFAGSNTNYIVSQMDDLLNYASDNTLTWYWAEEGGRENFELRLEVADAENPKDYDGNGHIKNITQLTNSTRRLVTKVGAASDKGFWVYEQPIYANAANRIIEIINTEPKSYSNTGDGNTYTYDKLLQNCKVGDVVFRIPEDGNFINFSLTSGISLNASAWECKAVRPNNTDRQLWKKIF